MSFQHSNITCINLLTFRKNILHAYVRCEVFTALAMRNVVFWNIKTHFVPHRRNIISKLLSPAGYCYARFEIFTEVTIKNAVFWCNIPEDGILHTTCMFMDEI
jgi:hypothetical protein